MRHACKECPASYRYPQDLEEHQRVGHVKSSAGPTWSDKDVDEVTEEPEIEGEPPAVEAPQE